jgi:predicted dehydrogenase
MPKERLEVYGEGGVAILDDYRTLELSRSGRNRTAKFAGQDKGFTEEMRRFLSAVRTGDAMPIPFEQSLASSRATIAIVESLRSGAPVAL